MSWHVRAEHVVSHLVKKNKCNTTDNNYIKYYGSGVGQLYNINKYIELEDGEISEKKIGNFNELEEDASLSMDFWVCFWFFMGGFFFFFSYFAIVFLLSVLAWLLPGLVFSCPVLFV